MTFSIKTLVRTGLRETNQNITPKVKKKESHLLIDVSIEKIVHRAPLKIVVPNPKSASIFMSGSSALFAANAIDL